MAKYDTYTLSVQLGKDGNRANLTLSVLFEEGDEERKIIELARLIIQDEALIMEETKFLKTIEQ